MALPARTKMWLNVACCTGLGKLSDTNGGSEKLDKTEADNKVKDAKKNLQKAFKEAGDAEDDKIAGMQKKVQKAQKELVMAEAKQKNVADGDDKVVPNPFVVVSIDGDDDDDIPPMLYTKAIRETSNPIWKEKFDEFPLEMYLTGKKAYEMYHNEDKNYRPQNLVFYIYHDNAVPDEKTNKPKESDDNWKRDKPQRDIPIGKATWEFHDLCRKVGCPEFEKDIPIFNPKTSKKIKDAVLTIKVRLCAPKIKNCLCARGKEVDDDEYIYEEVEESDDDEGIQIIHEKVEKFHGRSRSPKPTKKIINVRSSRNNHNPSRIPEGFGTPANMGFQKPSGRRTGRKKVRFSTRLAV